MDILFVCLSFTVVAILLAYFTGKIEGKLDRLITLVLMSASPDAKIDMLVAKEKAVLSKLGKGKKEPDTKVHVSGGVQEEVDRYKSVKNLKEVPPDEDEQFEKAKEE